MGQVKAAHKTRDNKENGDCAEDRKIAAIAAVSGKVSFVNVNKREEFIEPERLEVWAADCLKGEITVRRSRRGPGFMHVRLNGRHALRPAPPSKAALTATSVRPAMRNGQGSGRRGRHGLRSCLSRRGWGLVPPSLAGAGGWSPPLSQGLVLLSVRTIVSA